MQRKNNNIFFISVFVIKSNANRYRNERHGTICKTLLSQLKVEPAVPDVVDFESRRVRHDVFQADLNVYLDFEAARALPVYKFAFTTASRVQLMKVHRALQRSDSGGLLYRKIENVFLYNESCVAVLAYHYAWHIWKINFCIMV